MQNKNAAKFLRYKIVKITLMFYHIYDYFLPDFLLLHTG